MQPYYLWSRGLLGFVAPLFLLASPAAAQSEPPLITPGSTHRFATNNGLVVHDTAPLLVERVVVGNPPHLAFWNADAPQDPGTYLRATSVAKEALSRSKVVVAVFNDFDVASGVANGEAISAQISASIEARGFLLLMGAGKAQGKVTLKIIDVTEKETYTLDSYEVLKEDIEGSMKPTIGVDVGALLPVPDGEAGISLEFETEGEKKLINEDCDVGRLVLLRRGHRYRVQLELETLARTGVIGGIADAAFWMQNAQDRLSQGLDPAPSLLTRSNWRGAIESIATLLSLSKLDDSTMLGYPQRVTTNFLGEDGAPRLAPLLSRDTISLRSLTMGSDRTISSVLRGIGLPGNLSITELVDWLPDPSPPPDEAFESLGVSMTNLSVTLAPDANDAARRDLEESLAAGKPLVSLYLPTSAGGRLDEILFLVGELIARSQEAGIATGSALSELELALALRARGLFQRSFLQAVRAYKKLVAAAR